MRQVSRLNGFCSGSTEYITPEKIDFIKYREFTQAENAEIADGKFLRIEGYGMIIGHSIMPNATASFKIQKVLYIPVNKQLYLLIAAGQHNCMSTRMIVMRTVRAMAMMMAMMKVMRAVTMKAVRMRMMKETLNLLYLPMSIW